MNDATKNAAFWLKFKNFQDLDDLPKQRTKKRTFMTESPFFFGGFYILFEISIIWLGSDLSGNPSSFSELTE